MRDGYDVGVACADATANSHIYSLLEGEKVERNKSRKTFSKGEYVANHLTRFLFFSFFSAIAV